MKSLATWTTATVALLTFLLPVARGDDALHGTGLGGLSRLSRAKTRSISPESFTGEKGKAGMATEGTGAKSARDLGRGWKISPSVRIKPGETFTMGEIQGEGMIQHIWMTPTGPWRHFVFRVYWDGEASPSIETPVGDFFATGWAATPRSPRCPWP